MTSKGFYSESTVLATIGVMIADITIIDVNNVLQCVVLILGSVAGAISVIKSIRKK